MFLNIQRSHGIKEPQELVQDVDTRWNSTEAMIESFIRLQVNYFIYIIFLYYVYTIYKVYVIEFINNITNLSSFSKSDWKVLMLVQELSKPITQATENLSDEKYPTASLTILIIAEARYF